MKKKKSTIKRKSSSKIKRKPIPKRLGNPPRKSKLIEKTQEDLENIGNQLMLMVGSLVKIELWPDELFEVDGILKISSSDGWVGERNFYCIFSGADSQFVKVSFIPGFVSELGKSVKGYNYVILRA